MPGNAHNRRLAPGCLQEAPGKEDMPARQRISVRVVHVRYIDVQLEIPLGLLHLRPDDLDQPREILNFLATVQQLRLLLSESLLDLVQALAAHPGLFLQRNFDLLERGVVVQVRSPAAEELLEEPVRSK